MHLSIYLALAAAVLLSRVGVPLTRRLAPQPAAWALAATSLASGLMWAAGLGCLAVVTVSRIGLVAKLGHWSPAVLRAHEPVPLATGIASLVLLVAVLASLTRAGVRLVKGFLQLRTLRASVSGHKCGDLAIIEASEPEAVTVPGWPGSIVVTSGMLRILEPAERAVLLAHERSHLRSGHWLFRLATRLGAALLPTARPLVAACDGALERWADEAAAAEVGDRQLAARSVAKAALASADYRRGALSMAFAEGGVGERVQALLLPRRASRWSLAMVLAVIVVLGGVALLDAGRELDAIFDLAKRLPFH